MPSTAERVAVARRWIAEQVHDEESLFDPDLLKLDLLLIADDYLAKTALDHSLSAKLNLDYILSILAPYIPELKEHSDER